MAGTNLLAFLQDFENRALLSIGGFKFVVARTAFEKMSRRASYRWRENERLVGKSTMHYCGSNNEDIEIKCTLFPSYAGKTALEAYEKLKEIADTGKPQVVVDYSGKVLESKWCIVSIDADMSSIQAKSIPKKIDLKISLREYVE